MGGARTGRGVARDAQGSRRSRTSGHGRMRPRLAAGATCDCEWPHATRVARVCRRVARAWRVGGGSPSCPSATARARPQAWRRRAGTSPAPAPSRAQARAGVAGPVFQGAGTHYAGRARIKRLERSRARSSPTYRPAGHRGPDPSHSANLHRRFAERRTPPVLRPGPCSPGSEPAWSFELSTSSALSLGWFAALRLAGPRAPGPD